MKKETFVKLVNAFKNKLSITWLCDYFGVARSTYYRWTKSCCKKDDRIDKIKRLCETHRFTYGYRKITYLLRKELKINHKAVQRIMQTYGLSCKVKIKRSKRPGSPYFKTDNVVNRVFQSDKLLEKLTTDITYLDYGPKRLYLSSIMDLFNGEILAYTISDKQDIACVLDTLHQLPDLPKDCLLHSDQGSVYTSYAYYKATKEKNITRSMSRKGTPADNAPIESFHATLKTETFGIQKELGSSTSSVIETVQNFITYYNKNRIQQKYGYLSPIDYRKQVTA